MIDVARKITFTGDEVHGAKYVSLACSLFDLFVSEAKKQGLNTLSRTIVADRSCSFRFFFYGNSGSINIDAHYLPPKERWSLDLTRRERGCHWNRKRLYSKIYYPIPDLWVEEPFDNPVLFHASGFEKICFGFTEWELGVLIDYGFGNRLAVERNVNFALNTSFFTDDVGSGLYPAIVGQHGIPIIPSSDFYFLTTRLSIHKCRLAYVASTMQASGFLYKDTYLDYSIDLVVPVQPGPFINGFGQSFTGYTPILGDRHGRMLRRSRVDFISHGVDPSDERTVLDLEVVSADLSDTYYGGGITLSGGTRVPGPCIFVGTSDFQQPKSFLQDFVGSSAVAYLRGTTEIGTMYYEYHLDDFPYYNQNELLDCDWYWFSTINSATIYIRSVEANGDIVEFAIQALSAFESTGDESYPDLYQETTVVTVPTQSGCVIRDVGACHANTMESARLIGGPRNSVFICTYDYLLHGQFAYNAFINFGSGFSSLDGAGQDASCVVSALDWSENGLFFCHNHGYDFVITAITSNAAEIFHTMLVAYFPAHTDGRKKELRFYKSSNYKWIVLYNAVDVGGNDISGVYERSGSTLSRVGDATGIEPVEIAQDESYILMQDKAYGAITGTFDRLVGFFYDRLHYLEMQSRPEDNLKRFVIKDVNSLEIKSLDWGLYSFYETAEDCSFAVITHCSINGVLQSTSAGTLVVVNFIDGPLEFETICGGPAYSFSIDVPNGCTETSPGASAHPPELASPYYGPPDREPPYGRKQISICYCVEAFFEGGQWKDRHRHHVMIDPPFGQGIFVGDSYCMHRPGFQHQRVSTVPIRTLYKNCRQQKFLRPSSTEQLLTLVALPDGYFYERVTEEPGPVDPLLLDTGEFVTDTIVMSRE